MGGGKARRESNLNKLFKRGEANRIEHLFFGLLIWTEVAGEKGEIVSGDGERGGGRWSGGGRMRADRCGCRH